MELYEEIRKRVEKLETFKNDIDKKLYAFLAVAGILGISGLFGGLWVNAIQNKILIVQEQAQIISKRNSELESKLKNWDQEVNKTFRKLEETKMSVFKDFEKSTKFSLKKTRTDLEKTLLDSIKSLEQVAKEKLSKILRIGTDSLIGKFQDGSSSLKLSSLKISNTSGVEVVEISAADGGDGRIVVNDENGDIRFDLHLANNKPQINYFNNDGKIVLSMGVYGDTKEAFILFNGPKGDKLLLKLNTDEKGGTLSAYGKNNGEQIVYIGPERNTGNGLVNVSNQDGEKTHLFGPLRQ